MLSINSLLQFQSPLTLWGLLFILVPIIVHLFNLRKAKKIQFSNVELLKKVQEESTSKKRPVELLILLFRILAVISAVLAFASPVLIENDSESGVNKEVIIYLDNSISMSNNVDEGSLYDQAFSLAEGLVQTYPDGTKYRLLENSYRSSMSTVHSKASISNYLTTLDQKGVDRSISDIAARKQSNDLVGDFYLISDFNAAEGLDDLISDSASSITLIPTISESVANIYVDSVYLENTFLLGDFSNNLVINLISNEKINEDVNLQFLLDGKLLGTAQVIFDNSTVATYEYVIPDGLKDLSKLSIELMGSDPAYDNRMFISINQLDQIDVLEVFKDNSNDYISSLYTDNELFIFERLNVDALQNSAFEKADIVILNELDVFSNQLMSAINSFVATGGTLLLIPSSQAEVSELEKLGISVVKDDNQKVDLESIDFENPFFDGVFEEKEVNLQMPNATTQFKINNPEYSLLSFKNGRPFISKVVSQNNIYFISSPINSQYSTFANHAIFVPVMYKLALGAQTQANKLYYYTDDEFMSFPTSIEDQNSLVKLSSGDEMIIPDQRIGNGQIELQIPKDELSPGQYHLVTDNDTLGVMSFNLPKSESIFNKNILEQLREASAYEHIRLLDIDSKDQAANYVTNSIMGKSIWRYFLIAALLFLFAEIILIRYL